MDVALSIKEKDFYDRLPDKRKKHFLTLKFYIQSSYEGSNISDRARMVIRLSKDILNEYYKDRIDDLYQGEFFSLDSRATPEYRNWRKLVLERDNYICVICGSKKKIQAHHIKSWLKHKDLRYVVDNGQTLCKKCHVKTDNYGVKARYETYS